MSTGKQIIDIIKLEILNDENLEINQSDDLLTSNTLDSMALIRLVAAIESKYEIKIPPMDLVIENFINIDAIENYIDQKIKTIKS